MRLFLLLFLLVFGSFYVKGQQEVVQNVRVKIDSIIDLVTKEQKEDRKVEILLSLYDVSIDGFPVLLFETYQKLYLLSQQKKDVIIESSSWSAAGQAYRLTGNYVKALECHQRGVNLAEKSGNVPLFRYALNQMAHIYKDRLENEKALSIYRLAGGFNDKNRADFKTYWVPMNMGAVYLNMGKLDSAYLLLTKALELYPERINDATLVYIYSNLGSVCSRKNDPEKAMDYFSKAIDLAEKFESSRFYNFTYVAVAEHFYRNKQIDSSVYYAKKAVESVRQTSVSNLALNPARMLAEIYQNNEPDSAIKYWKVYIVANDSLNNTRATQQLMMMSFEEEQDRRDLITERNNYRNKVKMNLVLSGLGAALLMSIVFYRNNRQKNNANRKMEKTLSDLKATQSQLIQSEKMASLGELTAGIAHEIQNPLNFVNNFSEVSNELIDEMSAELEKGDIKEAKAIAADVKQNLEKINHHGKRADSIVKGMLQHSRSRSGAKEPTDINALCDEYLRLSYHGLRAKDKTFNASIKTDFDAGVGWVEVIPQDIGRVVLNLLTNAFYAVNEKKKNAGNGYDPTVSVSTKKNSDTVEIVVSDNGDGIPAHVMDKIFQPFFTTKPTGQGTGLGLSLSYDIVKAHGGELKVETKENEGTVFIITLPV